MSTSVDEKASVLDAGYVVIDTELTGLDERKDSIVSLGALRMTGGRIELGESFYRLANPETALTSESVVIHGITPSDVVEKPSIDTVLAEFLQFCNDAIIV
ncbi:MAG TPA: 3'-5' exonuclease, partial [Thermodesulfovibrionales bacterium]|nr:3'-5' exonuclease [Thermodesulfovibrionales bacterium]